jgi:hypothetical protein
MYASMSESLNSNQSYPPHASLYLRGKDLDPQRVTDILGVIPQEKFKRGDIRQGSDKWKHGLWMLWSSEQIDSSDPLVHIKWLLQQIQSAQNRLIELVRDEPVDAEISLFWIMPSSHGVLILEPELLKEIALLGIPFELSIYSPE